MIQKTKQEQSEMKGFARRSECLTKVKAAIEQFNMIPENTSVTVALSGGADSVALLHVLLELYGNRKLATGGSPVSACHVNHNLRGAESDNDEAFVRKLCKDITIRSIDVKSMQKKHQSIEEAAREARYKFFNEFDCVATAHTASDNAETVLLNLIRGTGLKGLCGIPPVRENIIRPLIFCDRSDIEEYCRERNLEYVTDSTNSSEKFTRNKVRLSLIPIIKEINPTFDESITRMCGILREDSNYLEKSSAGNDFSIKSLKNLEKPLLTRIIKRLLSNNNISPSNLRISQIIKMIESGSGKINLEKHKFALVDDEILKIETIKQNYKNRTP